MAPTLTDVTRDALRGSIDRGGELVLVDALSPIAYAASHLPGAINLPPEWVEERARRRIPDLDSPIVVYCASPACTSSVEVAQQLVQLGYTNVGHYAGGKQDWIEAGLPLEGGRVGG